MKCLPLLAGGIVPSIALKVVGAPEKSLKEAIVTLPH